jgi:adenylate kinase family enzyme
MAYNKIIIIGDAGRGKTTLASKLSEKLEIDHYSTDDFFYEIKFSKSRTRDEALNLISKAYQNDKWIVEGTTQWLLQPGLESADIIIYLKYNNIFSQWYSIIKRYFTRGDESVPQTLHLLRHVFYKRYGLGYKKGKVKHTEVIAPYLDKVIVLSSYKEINNFIDKIHQK